MVFICFRLNFIFLVVLRSRKDEDDVFYFVVKISRFRCDDMLRYIVWDWRVLKFRFFIFFIIGGIRFFDFSNL